LGPVIETDILGMALSMSMLIVLTQTITIAHGWNSMLVGKVGIGTGAWLIEMPQTTG
jgi:hypothetical protein